MYPAKPQAGTAIKSSRTRLRVALYKLASVSEFH